ncbi:hypothetical protein PMIN01_13017 [Paraphaeosphaeria minitans]|uniref:Uncharacterized protein n=1 Tax=Paraphaeosphaeria minitans TaxID=565426 RepID=A0A9P6G5P6_9PLEO|nr:hypothetical protein PMIN01_13017 [Paraphaeosphaeria minitans]
MGRVWWQLAAGLPPWGGSYDKEKKKEGAVERCFQKLSRLPEAVRGPVTPNSKQKLPPWCATATLSHPTTHLTLPSPRRSIPLSPAAPPLPLAPRRCQQQVGMLDDRAKRILWAGQRFQNRRARCWALSRRRSGTPPKTLAAAPSSQVRITQQRSRCEDQAAAEAEPSSQVRITQQQKQSPPASSSALRVPKPPRERRSFAQPVPRTGTQTRRHADTQTRRHAHAETLEPPPHSTNSFFHHVPPCFCGVEPRPQSPQSAPRGGRGQSDLPFSAHYAPPSAPLPPRAFVQSSTQN